MNGLDRYNQHFKFDVETQKLEDRNEDLEKELENKESEEIKLNKTIEDGKNKILLLDNELVNEKDRFEQLKVSKDETDIKIQKIIKENEAFKEEITRLKNEVLKLSDFVKEQTVTIEELKEANLHLSETADKLRVKYLKQTGKKD
jgi:chromosome segregation protein